MRTEQVPAKAEAAAGGARLFETDLFLSFAALCRRLVLQLRAAVELEVPAAAETIAGAPYEAVAAVGIGPFPGVLALTVFSLAILAKLTSESVEAIDDGPIQALEAAGATKLEMIRYAVVPQVLPLYLSYFLYVFEINIRASTVLGLVGAGGIGQQLQMMLSLFQYENAFIIIVVTFVLGLATPLAASMLSGVMLTAIRTVHWERGVWSTKGGYEYPAVILAGLFALTGAGPGRLSLDAALGSKRRGLRWAIAELAAAVIGSSLVIRAGRQSRETDLPATEAAEEAPLRHAA